MITKQKKHLTLLIIAILVCSFNVVGQGNIYTIPTIVHVAYNSNSQNISDARINEIIDSVNINLAGGSPNQIIQREIFDTLNANTEINLCLAGIKRAKICFNYMLGDFWTVQSDLPSVDNVHYLNIWIMSQGVGSEDMGGWTTSIYHPFNAMGAPSSDYGIVVNKDFHPNNSSHFINVMTHEVGHFFSLLHTFEGDNVVDTPCSIDGTGLSELTCPVGAELINSCSLEAPFWGLTDAPDMVENFMSYHIACQKMFTKGQKTRMRNSCFSNFNEMISNAQVNCLANISGFTDCMAGIISLENNISLYPNPVNDELFIELNVDTKVELINSLGQSVKNEEIKSGVKKSINVSSLTNGVYFLKLSNTEFSIQKIIVKH